MQFCDWFQLSIMFSRFISVTPNIQFLFMAEQYSIIWMQHTLSICLFVDGHLGCFYLWAILNNAAMNVCEQVLSTHMLSFLLCRYLGMLTSEASSTSMFNFLRHYQISFHSGGTIFHSHQQCRGFQSPPHPRQHLSHPSGCKAASLWFRFSFPS